ncbi:MAG: ribosomal RNA small subunit methyltransferase A [Chlorobiota bacterium]|nr:ribosomal RNA small subunit methyltransferase A [Chlorobiota bacterium]QQS66659.1 MAG: ribosomal RNA small subunit methyltransferase A [Chlorobiota bacterium]
MIKISPKKSLGQHFLTDKNISQKIIVDFDPKPNEYVIEIGPGEGSLTGLLIDSGCKLTAIEIDNRAAELIRKLYDEKVTVLEQDILKTDFIMLTKHLNCEKVRVIGNIPYYITSGIIFHIIEYRQFITDAMLMMQKEVAKRLIAKPRTKEYGSMSIAVQTYFNVKILFHVGPNSFFPAPKVTSSIVKFTVKKETGIEGLESLYEKIVQSGFNQRRKTLRNSLNGAIPDLKVRLKALDMACIKENQRAEELSVVDFIRLTKIVNELIGK